MIEMEQAKKSVRVIVMDVDGTLTDGTINIGNDGELFKGFYCRDGLAIIEARKHGIIPVILTSRISQIVEYRAKELGIETVIQDAQMGKYNILKEYISSHCFKSEEIAYIGDDRNDLEAMSLCGLIGCPSDSIDAVKKKADFVCEHPGGRGAVREFIDWLLDMT